MFIGNLDPEVDEKLLYDTFSAFGVILQTPKVSCGGYPLFVLMVWFFYYYYFIWSAMYPLCGEKSAILCGYAVL